MRLENLADGYFSDHDEINAGFKKSKGYAKAKRNRSLGRFSK
jgi:hypothetical protein